MHAVAFASAAGTSRYPHPDVPACLILDVGLPDISGLELQDRLASGHHPHIVFITGRGDVPSSVRAMKAGAVDFLPKPFDAAALMRAVDAALARNRDALRTRDERAARSNFRAHARDARCCRSSRAAC